MAYFPDFQDNPSSPATQLQLEVQSKFIQVNLRGFIPNGSEWMLGENNENGPEWSQQLFHPLLHQIYSAKMEIHAQLSGLRHIMWAKITLSSLILDHCVEHCI